MSERKQRPDSKLKTLPEGRQEAIVELLRGKSLQDVRRELAADGLHTSIASLSEFYSWWQLRQRHLEQEGQVEELLTLIQRDQPEMSEDALFEYGQRMFGLLSMKEQSAADWQRIQSLGLKRKELTLARQRFQRETAEMFLKWWSDRQAQEIAAGSESNASKIERLGELMFGEDWDGNGKSEGRNPKSE